MPLLRWRDFRLVGVFVATVLGSGLVGLTLSVWLLPSPIVSVVVQHAETGPPRVAGRVLHIYARFVKTKLCDVRSDHELWRCVDGPPGDACLPPRRREVALFERTSETITQVGLNVVEIDRPLPRSAGPGVWHYLSVGRYACPVVIPFTHVSLPLQQITDHYSPDFTVTVPP